MGCGGGAALRFDLGGVRGAGGVGGVGAGREGKTCEGGTKVRRAGECRETRLVAVGCVGGEGARQREWGARGGHGDRGGSTILEAQH